MQGQMLVDINQISVLQHDRAEVRGFRSLLPAVLPLNNNHLKFS